MADPAIQREILMDLQDGCITVERDSALRDELQLACSKNKVNRAMGSLIKQGRVGRSRREPQSMFDDNRPVTYWLKG